MAWAKVKLFYSNVLADLTATSTAAGYAVANLLDWKEGSWWQATSTADQYITFDAGANKTVGADYLGIANHNLAGATVMLQYSNDNFSSDINDAWEHNISEFATSEYDASATGSRGISFASNGTLWVCDTATNKIYNMEIDGTLIDSFANSVFDASATNVTGISFAPDGTLWVCDGATDKIYNIEIDGTWISEFATSVFDAGATDITGISFAVNGTIWLCDSVDNKIYNTQADGTLIDSFPTSDFDPSATSTTGISFASNGTLLICDSATNKIYNIQTNGALIDFFPTSIYDASSTTIQDVTLAPDGTLWVCDPATNKIYNVLVPIPIDNKPFLREFPLISSRYWRIKLSDLSAIPYMAICIWGRSTELDYCTSSFDPYAETIKANIKITQGGVVSGIHIKYSERQINLKFNDADDTLYQKIKRFWDDHGLKNCFLGWETMEHPNDVFLMRRDEKFNNPFTKGGLYRNVTLNLKGRKE